MLEKTCTFLLPMLEGWAQPSFYEGWACTQNVKLFLRKTFSLKATIENVKPVIRKTFSAIQYFLFLNNFLDFLVPSSFPFIEDCKINR